MWLAYAIICALLVATSPGYGIEGVSYFDAAYGVLLSFAGQSIYPPIHILGLPLIIVGLCKGTRPLPFLCGLLGILLWVGTSWLMTGLWVT